MTKSLGKEKAFVKKLPYEIQKKLLIRLHSDWSNSSFNDNLMWKNFNSNLVLDHGKIKLEHLISNSRIVIFSYQCTGFLECLAMNVPTILILQGGLQEIDVNAKMSFEKLQKHNIFFNDPILAAEHISNNWKKISEWWGHESVQDAINDFCFFYSRIEKNPIELMKNRLLHAD